MDPNAINSEGLPTVQLLVMGLTGSGKSTFIQKATGDPSIETGAGLGSSQSSLRYPFWHVVMLTFDIVTKEVSSYPVVLKGREVFLIDSPGFDDDMYSADDVLQEVANFINNIHSLGWVIGGIIYIHDITRERMGGEGKMNIRVLESLTGKNNWNHITLVTNKWGDSRRPEAEAQREKELRETAEFWGDMNNAAQPALICRFDNTESGARKIIERHLDMAFVPQISNQMVAKHATLGATDAGQVIRKRYAAIFSKAGQADRLDHMNENMGSTFQGLETQRSIHNLLQNLHELERRQMLQRVGRWAVRLAAYGGGLAAAVVMENPMAFKAALQMAVPLEMRFREMRRKTKDQTADVRDQIANTALYGPLLGSGRITELEDC